MSRATETIAPMPEMVRGWCSTPAVETALHRAVNFFLGSASASSSGWRSRPPHQLERLLEVLVAELHLSPLAPHRCEIVHVLELHLHP